MGACEKQFAVLQNIPNSLWCRFVLWYNAPVHLEVRPMFNSPLNQLLNGDVAGFVAFVVSLIVAITIHEFAHAAAATWLGDPLPGRQGRLTLSPAAHLDPIGSLMILVAGFGYGRPVQFNPYALRTGPRVGAAIVAVAGPVSNIALAVFLSLIVRAVELGMGAARFEPDLGFISVLMSLSRTIVLLNLVLAFFNLIPIFPLDGFSVLLGILPPDLAFRFEQTRTWGVFLLFALIFFGGPVLSLLLGPPVFFLSRLLLGA
jgi:Zn-dependent protease